MLTRRTFVRTVGSGAAAAWVGARGRENSLWSLVEPGVEAVAPGTICLSSNENPLGPGTTVLNAIKAAFRPAGARPGRDDGSSGALIEGIAKERRGRAADIGPGCRATASP